MNCWENKSVRIDSGADSAHYLRVYQKGVNVSIPAGTTAVILLLFAVPRIIYRYVRLVCTWYVDTRTDFDVTRDDLSFGFSLVSCFAY